MDQNSLISIIIAIVSSSALTAFINYISNRAKNKAEARKLEQDIVGEKIDQALAIVDTSMKLLEDVQDERDRLVKDKKELVKINTLLSKEIEKLQNNINKFKTTVK